LKQLVFSKWYAKLSEGLFITLRKRPQCFAGEIVEVTIKKSPVYFHAQCLQVIPLPLEELSDELLQFDTDCSTRKEAINLLQSFYRNKIEPTTKFYLHILTQKINGDEL
jgi:hypothetical protein